MAASVILGSTLLEAFQRAEKLKRAPATTGCRSIDDVLGGGFCKGEIASIAGPSGMGKSHIALQALAGHLLADQKSEAAVIDTAGTFSPTRLRDIIASRLSAREDTGRDQSMARKDSHKAVVEYRESGIEAATNMLDRVRVMRVFDLTGVLEATSEIIEIWEAYERKKVESRQRSRRMERGIASSQDEEDEDMGGLLTESEDDECEPDLDGGCITMIIIDNIANVVNAELSKSQVQGQAFLSTFHRSLHHLTARRNVCTLLINASVGLASATSHYQRKSEDDVSIFATTVGKPALGKSYAYLIDLSIFVSSVPKTREDAEAAYAGNEQMKSRCQYVGIFEVLKDRTGDREGNWAAFETIDGIRITSYE